MSHINLFIQNEYKGPYSEEQVRAMYNSGSLTLETLYWTEGMNEWLPVDKLFSRAVQTDQSYNSTNYQERHSSNRRTDTSGLAIASLIFALLGIFPAALIMGHCAKVMIKRNLALTGNGLAVAGLILGYLELVVAAALIGLCILGAQPQSHWTPGQLTKELDTTNALVNNTQLTEAEKNVGMPNPFLFGLPWNSDRDTVQRTITSAGYSLDEKNSSESVQYYDGGTFEDLKKGSITVDFHLGELHSFEITFHMLSDSEFSKLKTTLTTKFEAPKLTDKSTQWTMANGTWAVFAPTSRDIGNDYYDTLMLFRPDFGSKKGGN